MEYSDVNEVHAPAPKENGTQGQKLEHQEMSSNRRGEDSLEREESGLDELFAPAPEENPDEGPVYQHIDLEGREQQSEHAPRQASHASAERPEGRSAKVLTQLYVYSYLVLFSILGVLSRIGLEALTLYPGALVPNTDLWANVGGSFIIGFLREDRMLFRRHWIAASEKFKRDEHSSSSAAQQNSSDQASNTRSEEVQKAYAATRASIPAYIGLTVGYCGSLTSFASICRDTFLALSNSLDTDPTSTNFVTAQPRSRDAGFSVMAVIAVVVMEVGLSLTAIKCGAHLATATEHLLNKFTPSEGIESVLNPLAIWLGWGAWLGAVVMAIWPPHDRWRGEAIFALVFAPLGCFLRFQLSIRMNRLIQSFPLGTFSANVFGTCVLAMAYDLQYAAASSNVIGCQLLQGIEDGFCGALTTVSTWVLELDTLKLKHAYLYGFCSLGIAVGMMTAVMGPVRWTIGFTTPVCVAR